MDINKDVLKQMIASPNYISRTFNVRIDQMLKLKEIAYKTKVPISKYLRACIDTIIYMHDTNQL